MSLSSGDQTDDQVDESIENQEQLEDSESGSEKEATEVEEGEMTLELIFERLTNILEGEEWEINHQEPSRWSDREEKITIENRDLYSRENQTHKEFDTTGVVVEINDHNTKSWKDNVFSTEFNIYVNEAAFSSTTLVKYAGATEVIEWAERMVEAINETPSGWVPTTRPGYALNRWTTLNGNVAIQVEQEDRNLHDAYREYRLVELTRNRRGEWSRKTIEKNLRTEDLYNVAINRMDHLNDQASDPYSEIPSER